jgi:ABC-type Mn2+/Zn2+ transport system permease subunit
VSFDYSVLLSAAVAIAAGLVGCFAVMRRMALAGDALSHVALPGVGLALALHVHPIFGAVSMLAFGALLVWQIEDQSHIATETVVGVIFSVALAIGSMLTSGEDLIEALFGSEEALSSGEILFGLAGAAVVVAFVVTKKNSLVVALVSPDIARTAGIDVRRLNLMYLQMFALTVALGLRFLGVLLMGSLIIIPAASAKNLSSSLNQMLILAAVFAVAATAAGSSLALWLHEETGPLIVTVSTIGFLITVLFCSSANVRGAAKRSFER